MQQGQAMDGAERAALAEVADTLYGMLPEEFTAARNDRAKDAAAAGGRQLAKDIRALRRPTTSAWLLNRLVREHPKELEKLLDLGASLRQAQESLAGEELKQLSRQRRQVIYALAQQARGLAADAGHRVGEDVERELEASLDAALADPAAAEALRSARLLRSLQVNGFDPVDLTDATAVSDTIPHPPRHQQPSRDRPGQGANAKQAQQRRETEQRHAAHQREARIAAAEQTVRQAMRSGPSAVPSWPTALPRWRRPGSNGSRRRATSWNSSRSWGRPKTRRPEPRPRPASANRPQRSRRAVTLPPSNG